MWCEEQGCSTTLSRFSLTHDITLTTSRTPCGHIAAVELLSSWCTALRSTIKWHSDERERWRAGGNNAVRLWGYWFTGPEVWTVVHSCAEELTQIWSSSSLPKMHTEVSEMPLCAIDVGAVKVDENILMGVWRAVVSRESFCLRAQDLKRLLWQFSVM